jgi:hypothetical protein
VPANLLHFRIAERLIAQGIAVLLVLASVLVSLDVAMKQEAL